MGGGVSASPNDCELDDEIVEKLCILHSYKQIPLPKSKIEEWSDATVWEQRQSFELRAYVFCSMRCAPPSSGT